MGFVIWLRLPVSEGCGDRPTDLQHWTSSQPIGRPHYTPQKESSNVRGSFEKFVEWWQCADDMQREVVNVMQSCSGGGNVVLV
jgi:hypothetical protein